MTTPESNDEQTEGPERAGSEKTQDRPGLTYGATFGPLAGVVGFLLTDNVMFLVYGLLAGIVIGTIFDSMSDDAKR